MSFAVFLRLVTCARRNVEPSVFLQAEWPQQAFVVGGKSCGYWLFAATLYIESRQPAKVNFFSLCPPMLSRLFARNGLSRENTRETGVPS